MSRITTHVLDQSLGRPASGVEIILFFGEKEIARGRTNTDGRIGDWPEISGKGAGKLWFGTGEYFRSQGVDTFYPFVEVSFEIKADGHYHIPLLLSPWGYSTYRGS